MNSQQPKILVVEDDSAHAEAIRRALVDALAADDLVRVVGTLREYRQQIADDPPDLVLIDLNLPDGLALEALTAAAPERPFPLLVMTAHGDETMAVAAMKAGALDYIVKSPAAFAAMPQAVSRALREWRLLQEHRRVAAALQNSEERYRHLYHQFNTVFQGVPDPLLLLKWDHRIQWVNPAATQAFGRGRPDLANALCHEIFQHRATPCDPCPLRQCFTTGEIHEIQMHTHDGHHWSIRGLPIRGTAGEIRQVLLLCQDIGNKIQAQTDAIRASHLAALGELAAGVAHEINNPTNGIINYAQMLVNHLKDDDHNREIAERIIREGNRIATIVGGLLSYARPQQEKKQWLSLAETLDDCLSLAGAQLRRDGIELRVDLAPNLPRVMALKYQIQQVFLNLISNARYALNEKYPHADPGKMLEITGETLSDQEGCWLRIIFKDHGAGIPKTFLPRVFNPFFTTKPPSLGTGLGLSISHGIIENHAGRLSLVSNFGEFTAVTIDLPVPLAQGD